MLLGSVVGAGAALGVGLRRAGAAWGGVAAAREGAVRCAACGSACGVSWGLSRSGAAVGRGDGWDGWDDCAGWGWTVRGVGDARGVGGAGLFAAA